ncbi:sugar kinase [Pseudoalteromonas sp. T1lg23B]|uniref:sugar kinase n=1 Tax=Pseudoalteromonas sp. T1lg23B TaxID=2077097 RepID=UPI000CF6834A|nr:sugar kinase [Pseudoalteromonas sp. T1lg23B]
MNVQIKKVVFFGECMIEHRADGNVFFGGDTFNTAWYCQHLCAQLAHAPVAIYYASAIGATSQEESAFRQLLVQNAINDDFLLIHPHRNMARYWVSHDQFGERRFRFDRANSAARDYFELDETLSEALTHGSIDAVYLSGVSLAILPASHRSYLIDKLRKFKRHGGTVIFDNNYRPSLWECVDPQRDYLALMAMADIAFLTDDDEYALYGTSNTKEIIELHARQQSDRQLLVVRQGAAPCVLYCSETKTCIEVPAYPLEPKVVVDTCAAGDAFSAGFLIYFLLENDLVASATFAHHLAGVVIQHQGALISPTLLPNLLEQEHCVE